MARPPKSACCTGESPGSGFKVLSLVGVDERGQMVLPKEVREAAGIQPGDKLAIISCEKNGEACCLALMKIERLTQMVKNTLGPVMTEIFRS